MRKTHFNIILISLLSLLFSSAAFAQSGYVNVTATIPNYPGGQISASFQNQSTSPQLPLLNGSVFPTTGVTNLDYAGRFTFALADNGIIQPTPSQWTLILCAKAGNPSQPCYPVTITITCTTGLCVSGTLDVSGAFSNAPVPPGGTLPIASYAGQMLTANGPGQIYSAATAQCSTVLTDAQHVCITAPPYYGYGGKTTALGSAFSPGTSTQVASCAGTIAGEGVIIAEAGAGGADYLGTVASCSGTTLNVSPATSTSVPIGSIVIFGENATTTATFAAGTSGQVSTCATFLPKEGILIGGAGAAGANYVGTVISCIGSFLTVTPATSTSVGSGAAVQHDESAAFQAAVTAGALTGITIYVPDGFYMLNGPLQDPSHANAVIDLPNLNYGAGASPSPIIDIRGFTKPSTLTAKGTFLYSSIASGNVIGAYNPSSPAQFVGFTNYWVDIENINFRTPHNPGMVLMNLYNAVGARIEHVRCDSGTLGDGPLPTNTNSGCLYFPVLGNNVNLSARDLAIAGYANAVWAYEHADIDGLYEANDINGLIPDSGPLGNTAGHNTIHVGYWWCQVCTNMLSSGLNPATVQIDTMDIESITGYGFNDPTGLISGKINYLVPLPANAVTPTNPSVNGAANLCLYNLSYPNVSQGCAGGSGPSGVPISTASLIDNWPSQEGAGTTLLNTGSNGTANNATTSNVTWSTAAGFAGKVAIYNGTSSASTATLNNTFDGTAPFSECAWITPSSLIASTNPTIVGDMSGSSPSTGFEMDLYNQGGTGAIIVWLINTVG
ncbi:MAG TPA: hypothetical protein VGF36_12730, partial [Rhodopila sp.]